MSNRNLSSEHPTARRATSHGWHRILALVGLFRALDVAAQTHVDILVYRRGEELRLGGFDFSRVRVLEQQQVFATRLEKIANLRGGAYSDSPGWNAVRSNFQLMPEGSSALPGGASIRFELLPTQPSGLNLSYWNGEGSVVFGPVPDSEVLRYSGGDAVENQALARGTDQRVPGFEVATTGASGYVHRHLSFGLYGNESLSDTSPDAPTPGVYLVSLEATVTGFDRPSNPIYLLLGNAVPPQVLASAERYGMAQIVPEPGPASLLAVAGFLLFRHSRHRSFPPHPPSRSHGARPIGCPRSPSPAFTPLSPPLFLRVQQDLPDFD